MKDFLKVGQKFRFNSKLPSYWYLVQMYTYCNGFIIDSNNLNFSDINLYVTPFDYLNHDWTVKQVEELDDISHSYFVTAYDNEERKVSFYQNCGSDQIVITPEMIDLVE